MYSAETTIVDVKQTGESEYTLSMTSKDLYVAAQSGDVLRRHDVSASAKAPEKKYVALSGVKFAEATGKYTFTFASGDVFESTSDTAYPTAESVSDETGGGSGGGVLVEIKTDTSYASATCSHTKEQLDAIREAKGIVNAVITVQDGKGFFSHLPAMFMPNYTGSGYEYNISAVRWSSSNMSDFKLRKIVANVSTLGNVTISKANQT